jgi:hypothetical protein
VIDPEAEARDEYREPSRPCARDVVAVVVVLAVLPALVAFATVGAYLSAAAK